MPQKTFHNQQDEMLWKQMKEGSVHAFESLYDRYFAILFAYGLQFCADRALVKDCLQELFVDLFQRRSRLSDVRKVKQYLFVAFRHCLLRQVSSRNSLLESISENYHFQVDLSHEHQMISDQYDEDCQKLLRTSFSKLSSRQKEAIFLRFYENMSYAEIAEVMKMKEVKYARNLIYRALVCMKSALKGHSLTLYCALPFFLFYPGSCQRR